uniref:ankyrin repeat domain-containing protein 26-like n=1 Tax=Arvicanthis niloticus TaxID=61156 RepID=UPI00148758E3|nr:ankyrin repeat domain-containing protein 26-like [Arvicanthis niloticus]
MLHYACAHGHLVVASLLIGWNSDIDLRDSDNCTALIKVDITQQFQCDMDLMGILGIKMISAKCKWLVKSATQYGHEGCALILLDHGADPNAKDNHGNTALHYAVWQNKTSMVNILLEHHADICIRNEDNFTPYTLARLRNNESLAKFLVDRRDQIPKADELKRLKLGNLKIKVQPERPTEDSEQPQVMLDSTSLVTEEADKQKVIGLRSAENLNDSWLHSSEDQFQSVVHASENENHSAICVSENLNPNLANTSANKSQTEVPENLMNSVVHEAEKPNQSAAALGLQKQDGQTEEQPVPVEENQEDDGLTAEKLKAEIMLQKKKNEQLSRVPSEKLIEEQVKLNQSLTQSLAETKRHNRELKKEIHNRLKNWRTMMDKDSDAHKNRDFSHKFSSTTHREEDMTILVVFTQLATLETKIGQEEFQRQCLENENNLLQQKLKDGKYQQKKCEIVEGRIKQLEEKILSLKTHMDNNIVERSEVEKLKKAIEEQHRSQLLEKINQVNQFLQEDAASNQQTEQEKQNYILLLEDELKNIESELVEITEEADKQKVIRLQSAENLNNSWVHASEDQVQSVVHASENGNHSAIHVPENLNLSSAYTSENESQTEEPAAHNLMNSVVH